ncbi:MAG TPA: hypothetical protein VG820_05060 [Fimbriimonadaceae bacterium]|nr:hypothetical protein [Fimbriimonadaceae bacterium]
MMPLLLMFVASTNANVGQPLLAPPIVDAVGIVILLAGAGYAVSSLRPGLPEQRFLTNMLLSLAITELGGLLAFTFLLRSGWTAMAPVLAGNVVVNIFVIAPRVVAFSRQ